MPEINLNIAQDVLKAWEDMRMRGKYQYLVLRLSNANDEIILEKSLEKSEVADSTNQGFQQLQQDLTIQDCRYVLYRVDWDQVEQSGVNGGKRTKIAFISTISSFCKVKSKLLYAASKEPLKRALTSISWELAVDPQELTLDLVMDKAKQFTK